MPFAWAAIGSAVIGAAGSAYAGSEQAAGQEQAANTQAGMFNTIQGNERPFIQGGQAAEQQLNELLGTAKGSPAGGLPNGYLSQQFAPTQAQLNAYPGYQFALQTGGQATRNADTPGVGALSGQALKDLTNFDVGTANTYYGQYFNQFQQQQNNIFNRLSGIAGLGQNAAGNLGNNGAQLGTGIAQAQAGAAASQAGGIVGATNAAGNSATLYGLLNYEQDQQFQNNLAGTVYCDYMLKDHLQPIRFHGMSGLTEYEFEYKSEPGIKRRGVIAQEVERLYPEAVSRGPKGFLMVDYSKLPGWDEIDALGRELDG